MVMVLLTTKRTAKMPNRELKKDIENGRGTQQGKGFIAELTYRKKKYLVQAADFLCFL